MSQKKIADAIDRNVGRLSSAHRMSECEGRALPSLDRLHEMVDLIRSVIFPGYYGAPITNQNTVKYHIGRNLEKLQMLLCDQFSKGLCFDPETAYSCQEITDLSLVFLDRIPEIKRLLHTDVEAVFKNDPAAGGFGEIIFCYPGIQALIHYRIAHEMLRLGIPVIPRIITEMAHSNTGIDIHPGARIGEFFSIDHGTGVVIGETCIIGDRVRLYQGVTLGAKSFVLDEEGNPLNTLRHPIIEDNVTIYSNTSVLGRITVGHDSIIGGNIWLTEDVAPFSKITQRAPAGLIHKSLKEDQ